MLTRFSSPSLAPVDYRGSATESSQVKQNTSAQTANDWASEMTEYIRSRLFKLRNLHEARTAVCLLQVRQVALADTLAPIKVISDYISTYRSTYEDNFSFIIVTTLIIEGWMDMKFNI